MAIDISTDAERATAETRLVVETLLQRDLGHRDRRRRHRRGRRRPGHHDWSPSWARMPPTPPPRSPNASGPTPRRRVGNRFVLPRRLARRVGGARRPDPRRTTRSSGALVVARHGRSWSRRESSLGRGLCRDAEPRRRALAAARTPSCASAAWTPLSRQVAEVLMAGSAENLQLTLDMTVRLLGEYLRSDAAFLRRNDHVQGLSILVAEWPQRENVPDPDPLGEVPFDVDPVFAAMKDLKTPYMPDQSETPEEYLERVEQGLGDLRGRWWRCAAPHRRLDLGHSRVLPLRPPPVGARGDQRPAGRRLDARSVAGAHRRRGPDALQRQSRLPDGPAQPPRPPPSSSGASAPGVRRRS